MRSEIVTRTEGDNILGEGGRLIKMKGSRYKVVTFDGLHDVIEHVRSKMFTIKSDEDRRIAQRMQSISQNPGYVVKYNVIDMMALERQKKLKIPPHERVVPRKEIEFTHSPETWYGRPWKDVVQALLEWEHPWKEGLEAIETLREHVPQQEIDFGRVKGRRRRCSEDDGEVSLDRYLAGRDDFYDKLMSEINPNGTKLVSISLDSTIDRFTTAGQSFAQTAALIAVIDRLEEQGHQVELTMTCHVAASFGPEEEFQHIFVVVPIKRFGEPVDVEQIASGMSPGFFRALILPALIESIEKQNPSLGYCLNSIPPSLSRFLPEGNHEIKRSFTMEGAMQTLTDVTSLIVQDEDHGES